MRWTMVLGLLALFALPAMAQEQEKTPEQQAREAAERRVEWQMRAYRSLNLSDSQSEQLKKILIDEELENNKRRDARRDKVRALLTPDQKEQFEEMVSRQQQRGRGGRGGGRRGGMMGRMGMDANALKDRLKLTDDQMTKIQAIMTEAGAKAMEQVREMRSGGGFDFNKMREMFTKVRDDVRKQIEPLLTDAQKPEFHKMNKEMDERMSQWMGGRGGSSRGGDGRGQRRQPQTPEQIIERRVAAAMEALAFGQEEAAVIQPLVEKLVSYQVKAGKALRDQREAIGKLEDEAQIRTKMAEYTKARDEYRQKLQLMSSGLRELVTVQQEAKLFALRVFDINEGTATTTAPSED